MSDPPNASDSTTEVDLETAIADVEASLTKIKARYQQVKKDKARKLELEAIKEQLKVQQVDNSSREPIKSELHYLEQELAEIEIRLESELFKWSSLSEPFWQAVRFGGIGVIIGWLLKSYNN
jgi:septation ring formation regulator EzrA